MTYSGVMSSSKVNMEAIAKPRNTRAPDKRSALLTTSLSIKKHIDYSGFKIIKRKEKIAHRLPKKVTMRTDMNRAISAPHRTENKQFHVCGT